MLNDINFENGDLFKSKSARKQTPIKIELIHELVFSNCQIDISDF